MVERLIPCATCSRHVKSSDAACPFCAASMAPVEAPAGEPFRRMAAAAAVAASVVALTACSSSSPSGSPPSGVVFYGSANVEDAAVTDDAAIGVGVFYGVASFEDATTTVPTKPQDAGDDGPSVIAFYGGAGIPDAGVDGAPDASSDAADSG
jgi:hypothetical protein